MIWISLFHSEVNLTIQTDEVLQTAQIILKESSSMVFKMVKLPQFLSMLTILLSLIRRMH